MWDVLLPIVQTVGLGVVLPAVAAWLGMHVRNALWRQALIGAAKRAGGVGYDYLVSRAAGMDPSTARREAFNAAVAYVETSVPQIITALGVKGDTVADMVRGELGQLFAQDASVTVQPKLQPTTLSSVKP